MAIPAQAKIAFSTANFQCKFSEISQIPVDQVDISSEFLFVNDCKFNFAVQRISKTDYEVDIRLVCTLGATIHCKASLIDQHGKEHLAKGEYFEIIGKVTTITIKILDTEKEGDYFLPGDALTVRCTLSVDKNRDTEDDTSNTIASPLADKEISKDLTALLLDDKDSDVTIFVQGKEFTAHKWIPRSRSKAFHNMFRHNMMQECDGHVTIHGCNWNCFFDYLHYLYSRKFPDISRENAMDLYYIAQMYNVQDLEEACLKFMINDLNFSSVCGYFATALERNLMIFLGYAAEFLVKNIKDIIRKDEWKSLTEDPVLATEILRIGLRITSVSSKG